MAKLSYTFSVFPCGLGVMVVLLSSRTAKLSNLDQFIKFASQETASSQSYVSIVLDSKLTCVFQVLSANRNERGQR
eukprot:791414-Amphidinium_carterae.1